jgi:hypothetical protein
MMNGKKPVGNIRSLGLATGGWPMLLPAVAVAIGTAVLIGALVPADWRDRALEARRVFTVPAVGLGMVLFLGCAWALRKADLRALRRQPAGTVLVCPQCRSALLEPRGRMSMLDGQTWSRCRGCGLLLAPRRSRSFLCFVFALSLLVTVTCLRLVGLHPITLVLLPGLVLGPAGLVISARALLARPRAAQPQLAAPALLRVLRCGPTGLRARTARYQV